MFITHDSSSFPTKTSYDFGDNKWFGCDVIWIMVCLSMTSLLVGFSKSCSDVRPAIAVEDSSHARFFEGKDLSCLINFSHTLILL